MILCNGAQEQGIGNGRDHRRPNSPTESGRGYLLAPPEQVLSGVCISYEDINKASIECNTN